MKDGCPIKHKSIINGRGLSGSCFAENESTGDEF
jgi:hypothetical protein